MNTNSHELLTSRQAEEYIIGATLLDPTIIDEWQTKLQPKHFSYKPLGTLWSWILDLYNKKDIPDITNITITHQKELEQAGGLEYIVKLPNSVVSTSNLDVYVSKVLDIYTRRRVMDLVNYMAEKALNVAGINSETLLDELEKYSLAIRPQKLDGGLTSDTQSIIDWYERLQERMQDPKKGWGMITGWGAVDYITTGWHRSDLIVVGARTSMGKTIFALENLLRLTERGYKCAMFSMEMSKEQLYERLAANITGVDSMKIRTGQITEEQALKVSQALDEISRLRIDDTRGVSTEYIASEMRRMKRREGLDFVVVDYLQEIQEQREDNDNQGSALGRAVRKLRKVAQECDCAVMALSQIGRTVENRQDKRPMLSDLSGSAGLESAADVVIMLYRDEYYNKETADKNIVEVIIGKQRRGETGKVKLYFDKSTQRMNSLKKEWES